MSFKILLIHGPNLNLLGSREQFVYGRQTSEDILAGLRAEFPALQVDYRQSNSESELVETVQSAAGAYAGFLINAGAYSHTSVALADAVKAVKMPCICVHISNIYAREAYRHTDLVGEACSGAIVGLGTDGYGLAMACLLDLI